MMGGLGSKQQAGVAGARSWELTPSNASVKQREETSSVRIFTLKVHSQRCTSSLKATPPKPPNQCH